LFFFADSFTFGWGVRDHETLPLPSGAEDPRPISCGQSFGWGYGAEHMLATIERGALATHSPGEPTHIFYAAVAHHVDRVTGKTPFSIYGPQYRLDPKGVPKYFGTKPRPPKPGGVGEID
jgi:hypothetical protein